MKTIVVITFLLFSLPGFSQWTAVNANMTNDFTDVQFINDSVGFVSGNVGAILKTTDYGSSWTNTNNTGSQYPFKFHFPGDSVGYALALNYLYKTVDQGSSWFALPNIQSFDKKNLFFINDSTGFFISAYGAIHKTTDGGMNWNDISSNCGQTLVEEDIYFPDQSTGYFGGWYATCASRSNDGGETWQVLPNNLLYIIKSIHFPSASIGYMAGWTNTQTEGIEKTSDGGNTWVTQNTPTGIYFSIYCTDTNTCYAVGPEGVIVKTTDGGASWEQQYSGTLQALWKIYCTDAITCYAVGDSGTILKTVNGGVGIHEASEQNSEVKIFPNPSTGKFTFSIANEMKSPFTLSVKNTFGQTVFEKQDLKSNEISFDLSDRPDGIYFIETQTDRFMAVKKILIKK